MAMTPEQWQQLAALKEQGVTQQQLEAAAAAKAPALNPGSPAGNPGYSFKSGGYSPQHYDVGAGTVTGGQKLNDGGVYYVGADPNGDTPENRAVFESWVAAQNPNMNFDILDYKGPSASTQPTGSAPINPPQGQQTPDWGLLAQLTPEERAALQSMNPNRELSLGAPPQGSPNDFTPEWSPEWTPEWKPRTPEQQALAQGLPQLQGLDPEALSGYTNFVNYQGPTGASADEIAQNFYTSIKNTPGAYENLTPQQKMQYQWLRFQNGEISGNNKDDQIKRIRQEAGLDKEQFDGEQRYIIRNKPTQENRRDGITPGDVFDIGGYTQGDTGKDDGLLEQFVNKSLPRVDLTDVLDAGGAPLQFAANIAAPFTYGLSAAAYNTLAAAEGRQDWGDAAINTVAAATPVIANYQNFMSPILASGAVTTGISLARGENLQDAVVDGLTNVGINVGTNLLVDTITGDPTASTWRQVLPEDVADSLGVYTDAGAQAIRDGFNIVGDNIQNQIDGVDNWLSGKTAETVAGTVPPAPEWLSSIYNDLSDAGRTLLNTEIAESLQTGALNVAGVVVKILTQQPAGGRGGLSEADTAILANGFNEGDRDLKGAVESVAETPETPVVPPEITQGTPVVPPETPQTPIVPPELQPPPPGNAEIPPPTPIVPSNPTPIVPPTTPNGGGETPDTPEPVPVPEYTSNVQAVPQDMSTLYQKPGFGIPDQKALFNFPRPRMLEPMITAAENSDQATFNEWLIKYLESGGDRGGLLAVFGASPMLERSGLI